MAAIVIWKHKKKRTGGKMESEHIVAWLKTLASLVVVMGVTWIIGVLVVEMNELIPLAYIYTIMVAFQGVWIFLLFVVFPKEVRHEWADLLKTKEAYQHTTLSGKTTTLTQLVSSKEYSGTVEPLYHGHFGT